MEYQSAELQQRNPLKRALGAHRPGAGKVRDSQF